MIDPKDRERVPNDALWDELRELAERHDVEILGRECDAYGVLLRGYTLPNPAYTTGPEYADEAAPKKTNLLLRIHHSHPHNQPDMFWARPFIKLPSGTLPSEAQHIENHFGKQWQRFSWHMRGGAWRPHAHTLADTFLPFIERRFREVV